MKYSLTYEDYLELAHRNFPRVGSLYRVSRFGGLRITCPKFGDSSPGSMFSQGIEHDVLKRDDIVLFVWVEDATVFVKRQMEKTSIALRFGGSIRQPHILYKILWNEKVWSGFPCGISRWESWFEEVGHAQ